VVGFTSAEEREIDRLYKRCHGAINGHGPSSGKNALVPTATCVTPDNLISCKSASMECSTITTAPLPDGRSFCFRTIRY
jgi:hypothetical protein